MLNRRNIAATAATTLAALASPVVAATASPPGATTGPSSSTPPYVLPVAPGVGTLSIISSGDAAPDGYRYGGIPDGLGAFSSGGALQIYTSHELRPDVGVKRRHGQPGAYVSHLSIDRATLAVTAGRDLIKPNIRYWDYAGQRYRKVASPGGPNPRTPGDTFPAQSAAFSRFCSSTLVERNRFFNPSTGNGAHARLYLANEEAGDEGRLFGITPAGQAYQLPRLGLFSWENTLVARNESDTTLVIGNEDGGAGQLRAYVGQKQPTGGTIPKAGLTNGSLNVIDVVDDTVTTDAEFRATYGKGTPARVDLNAVDWDKSGAAQNAEAAAKGLTLNRIEDGAFDPNNKNDYYFLTTEGGSTAPSPDEPATPRDGGGLWRLSFDDVENPEQGGTLTLVLDGSEAPYLSKPDNMDIDSDGNLLIQEDSGNNPHLARIVAYEISSGDRGVVAQFDPAQFTPGAPGFITQDEESSGIIDIAGILGEGRFLFDAQIHTPFPDLEIVEYGQLLELTVPDFGAVYTISDATGRT